MSVDSGVVNSVESLIIAATGVGTVSQQVLDYLVNHQIKICQRVCSEIGIEEQSGTVTLSQTVPNAPKLRIKRKMSSLFQNSDNWQRKSIVLFRSWRSVTPVVSLTSIAVPSSHDREL